MRRFIMLTLVFSLSGLLAECLGQNMSQPNKDSLLISFIYLKQGDAFIGIIKEQNDSLVIVEDRFMGQVSIQRKLISRIDHVYKNSEVILILGENVQYTGRLIKIDELYYTLKNEFKKEFRIPRNKVIEVEIREGPGSLSGNPNATRYFFAPSAIPLKKGKGYYHNAYLISNSVNFGITDNFSFGGGIVIPLLFYTTPKISFKVRKNLHLGAGVIAATTFIPDALISGGIPFGIATLGNNENNVTLGSGYGFVWDQGEFQKTNKPIVTLNGMVRISKRLQLVTENWFIPFIKKNEIENSYRDANGNWVEVEPTISESKELALAFTLGTRIILNRRTSFDIAPLYLIGANGNGVVIPYLDFVYKF